MNGAYELRRIVKDQAAFGSVVLILDLGNVVTVWTL
jgi:hypothetical protein